MNKRLIRKLSTLLCVSMVASNVPVFAQSPFTEVTKPVVSVTPVAPHTTGPAIEIEPSIVKSVTIGKDTYPVSGGGVTEINTNLDSVIIIFNIDEGVRVLANGEDATKGFILSVQEGDNFVDIEAFDRMGNQTQSFKLNIIKSTIDSVSTIRELKVDNVSYTSTSNDFNATTYNDEVEIIVYGDSAKSKIAFYDEDFFNSEGYGRMVLAVTEDVMEVPIRVLSYDGTSQTDYVLTVTKGEQNSNTRIEFMGIKPTGSEIDYIKTLGGRYEEGENYYLINTPAQTIDFNIIPQNETTKAYLDGREITDSDFRLDLALGRNEKELKLVAESGKEEVWTINFNHYDFSEECGIISVTVDDRKIDRFNFDHGSKGHMYQDGMNNPFYTVKVNPINPNSKVLINGVETRETVVDARQDVTAVDVQVFSSSGVRQHIIYDLRKDGRLVNSLLDLAEFKQGKLDKPFNMYEFDYTVTMPDNSSRVLAKFSPYLDNSKIKIKDEWIEDGEELSIPVYDGKVLAVSGLGYDGGESVYKFTFKVNSTTPTDPDNDEEDTTPTEPDNEEDTTPSKPSIPMTELEPALTLSDPWINKIAYCVEYSFLTELVENDDMFKSFAYKFLGGNMFEVTVTLHDGQSFSFQVKQQNYFDSILAVPEVKVWAQESTNYVYANNLFDDHSHKTNIVQELDVIKGLDLAFVTSQRYMLPESRDFYNYDSYVNGNGRYMPHVANMSTFLRDYTKFYSIDENMFTVDSMTRRDLADIVACMLWEFKVETENKDFPFTDVEVTDEIEKVYNAGIMIGRTPTEFCPDEEVTFAELMMVLARLHQSTLQ